MLVRRCRCTVCFFFFQAEDGIRDHCVTGVQTCALPIWSALYRPWSVGEAGRTVTMFFRDHELSDRIGFVYRRWEAKAAARSEERRVGKECRSRWWPCHVRGRTPPLTRSSNSAQSRADKM